jgi:hypothetical protein
VLFVLLLLVHHRAVLPAGIAAVLRGDTVAVFGDVTVGGQKVSPAALALAGRVAVVQPVHQVIGVFLMALRLIKSCRKVFCINTSPQYFSFCRMLRMREMVHSGESSKHLTPYCSSSSLIIRRLAPVR